jgi:hypothetical protein
MPTVQSDIIVRIKALVQGGTQLKTFLQTLKDLDRGGSKLTRPAQAFQNIANAINSIGLAPLRFLQGILFTIGRQLQFAAGAAALFIASLPATAFGLLIKEGIEFNSIMEQQQIGLAALIQSTNDLFRKDQPNKPLEGMEAFEAATTIARASTERLTIKLIPLRATIEDLLPIFNQIVTAGAAAGLTLEQTENVFVDLAAAAQVVNIPLDKLATGIRLLLNGTARATTVLATALFGSAQAANEWVKEHKKIGDLSDALHTKLEAFRIALVTSESSFATLAQNTRDVFQRLAGIATSGLFERLKFALVNILKSFYDLKALNIKPEFVDLFSFIQSELTKLGDYLNTLVGQVIDYLKQIAKYVQDNRAYVEQIIVDLISIAKQVGLIAIELGQVVADTFRAAKGTGTWDELLQVVARRIGSIHDAINVVIGAFQFLGGTIVAGILAPLQLVADILGVVSQRAAEAGNRIQRLRESAKDYATFGASRFFSGINEEGRNGVIAEQSGAGSVPIIDAGNAVDFHAHDLSDIESRLKKFGASGGKAGGGGASAAARKIRENAAALRALNKALSEARIADAQIAFDKTKAMLDREGEWWKQHYDDLRVGIDAFYVNKSTIERNTSDAEIKLLTAKRDELEVAHAAEIAQIKENGQSALAQQRLIQAADTETATKRKEINAEIALKQQEQDNKEQNNLRDRKQAWKDLGILIEGVFADIDESQDRTADAAASRIDAQFRDILDKLRVNFTENGELIKIVEKHVASLKQQAVLQQKLTEYDREQRRAALEVAQAQDQFNQGKLTQIEYERELNRLNDQQFARQEDLLAQAYLLAQTDEERLHIREALEQLKAAHVEINSLAQDINGAIRNDIGTFADSLVDDFQHVGDNFKKMALSIVRDIAKMMINALVLQTVFKRLGILPGSTGGIGGIFAPSTAGKFAGGGFIDGPGTETSDSILAAVSKNEAILPASAVRKYGRNMVASLINGSYPRFATGFNGGASSSPTGGVPNSSNAAEGDRRTQ